MRRWLGDTPSFQVFRCGTAKVAFVMDATVVAFAASLVTAGPGQDESAYHDSTRTFGALRTTLLDYERRLGGLASLCLVIIISGQGAQFSFGLGLHTNKLVFNQNRASSGDPIIPLSMPYKVVPSLRPIKAQLCHS
jgi:hypothetical protein